MARQHFYNRMFVNEWIVAVKFISLVIVYMYILEGITLGSRDPLIRHSFIKETTEYAVLLFLVSVF